MQTLQPTLRLGRDVWDREAMPLDEFHARAGRLRDAMAQRDLDALLLYGSNLNGCGHPTWLSNYIVKLPFAALVVLPREGDPALIFQGATRGRSAAQATTWIEDVRPCWNIADTCLAVLEDRGLTRSHLGLAAVRRLMPHDEWRMLADGLSSARLADAEDLVNRCRAVKSGRELAQIRRASTLVGGALDSVQGLAPSAGEWRLVAEVMREARVRGAEDIRVLIARPADRNPAFRPAEDEGFSRGGLVSVLLSASWERYWSEAIRTFRVDGNRFDLAADRGIHERFQAVVKALQGGTTTTQWLGAALAGMTGAENAAVATYGIGHGIGVTPEEWPALADEDVVVGKGMCFAVRMPFQSIDGLIWCGDTIVV